MKYLYVDESYREIGGHLHCAVGGLLLNPENSVEIELHLVDVLKRFTSCNANERRKEFKCNSFFADQTDEIKVKILRSLCEELKSSGTRAVLTHAHCKTARLPQPQSLQPMLIQFLAYQNLPRLLTHHLNSEVVQLVVDLGLSEGFKNVYNLYVGATTGYMLARDMELSEQTYVNPNFRAFPLPLFVQSQSSKLIQMADVLTGLYRKSKSEQQTEFWREMIDAAAPMLSSAITHSQEWNADS